MICYGVCKSGLVFKRQHVGKYFSRWYVFYFFT